MAVAFSTSIQAVNVDYYLGKPFPPPPPAIFRNETEFSDPHYPIIRVWGTLKEVGVTACAHIHGVVET